MSLNALIAQGPRPIQIEDPVNQLAKVMHIQAGQRQAQLGEMQMEEYGEKRERTRGLRDLLNQNYDTPDARESALMRGGYVEEATQLATDRRANLKADTENSAATFKLANDRYSTFQKTMGALKDDPNLSKQLLMQVGQNLVQQGIIPASMYQGAVADMPDDPALLRQRLTQGLATQLPPEKVFELFAPKAEKIDNGASISFRDTNPNSPTFGQQTGGAPIAKVQSPESIASNATARRGQDLVNARGVDANDLKRREIEMMGQPSSGAPVLGVPVPGVLPWANQSNPKDANKVKAKEMERGSKEIEKDVDAARKEAATAAAAKRFMELNQATTTGGLVDRIGLTRSLQGMGDNYSEMEAITAKLAPAMREPGAGSTSDFDGKQFERATVGVDKPKKANENIAKGIMARAQQAQEYADFRQTYLEQNGTLQGADRFWKDYVNKNPIFDPAKDGSFELNPKRKNWADHFKGGKADKPAAPTDALSPAEAAELAELRKRLGK